MKKQSWNELSTTTKTVIIVLGILQVCFSAVAIWDIFHRRQSELKGPRIKWVLISLISFLGPVAYFMFGKHKDKFIIEKL